MAKTKITQTEVFNNKPSSPENIIDRFFMKKEKIMAYSGWEVSVLEALFNDFNFCIGSKERWRKIALSEDQDKNLQTILPTFASINLFCTAIELFSRISHKSEPNWKNKKSNEQFFKQSAKEWFGQTAEQANKLWNLRNAITHHYKLEEGSNIAPRGSAGVAYKINNNFWIFSINEMHTTLLEAIDRFYTYIAQRTDKKEISDYLSKNCFIYITSSPSTSN